MKKVLALILTVVIMTAMSITASAADATITKTAPGGSNENATSTDVTGKYAVGTGILSSVYSVDITWGSMQFNYNGGTWDAENHVYTDASWATTEEADHKVTVTNNSNKPVEINVTYTPTNTKVAGTVTGGTLTLEAAPLAVDGVPYVAPSGVASLGLSGNLGSDSFTDGATIGTVTVTIGVPTP